MFSEPLISQESNRSISETKNSFRCDEIDHRREERGWSGINLHLEVPIFTERKKQHTYEKKEKLCWR